jgi:hypothetical protein
MTLGNTQGEEDVEEPRGLSETARSDGHFTSDDVDFFGLLSIYSSMEPVGAAPQAHHHKGSLPGALGRALTRSPPQAAAPIGRVVPNRDSEPLQISPRLPEF